MVLWGDKQLEADHFGYYKPVLLHGEPTDTEFHEQYPHMVTAWVYDHQYLDAEFNYNDLEGEYLRSSQGGVTKEGLKSELDSMHKH
jgi:hypothetical protein